MIRMILRLTMVLALTTMFASSMQAAEGSYSVQGRWYLTNDSGRGFTLDIDTDYVTIEGQDACLCTAPVIRQQDQALVPVDCLDEEGKSARLLFLFRSEGSAYLVVPKGFTHLPGRQMFDARRESRRPLPDQLVGTWHMLAWPHTDEEAQEKKYELQQDLVRISRAGVGTEVCRSLVLDGGEAPETELLLDCGKTGPWMKLRPVSPDLLIGLSPYRINLLYREGKRPAWLSWADAVTPDICDGITDPAMLEKCLLSRGLCDKIADATTRARCQENAIARARQNAWNEINGTLRAIRDTERAHLAVHNAYVGNQPPTPVADRQGNNTPTEWVRNTQFEKLGLVIERKVLCSYALGGSDSPTKDEGYTARAECDLDGDGQLSVWTITDKSAIPTHSGDDY